MATPLVAVVETAADSLMRHTPVEPVAPAAELANFDATEEEVFLLWASALAAAKRLVSAMRDIFARLRDCAVRGELVAR